MLQLSDQPVRSPGFMAQDFEGELVLFHPDRTEAHCLNTTAAMVWSLCDGKNSVAQIEQTLADVFQDTADISSDVRSTLDRFYQDKCIQLNEN